MSKWEMLHPRMTMDHLGYLPVIILPGDLTPTKEQLEDRYRHGGGFSEMRNFSYNPITNMLTYPGDPPFRPLAKLVMDNKETLYFYDHAILAIIQPDGSFAVTRVD